MSWPSRRTGGPWRSATSQVLRSAVSRTVTALTPSQSACRRSSRRRIRSRCDAVLRRRSIVHPTTAAGWAKSPVEMLIGRPPGRLRPFSTGCGRGAIFPTVKPGFAPLPTLYDSSFMPPTPIRGSTLSPERTAAAIFPATVCYNGLSAKLSHHPWALLL